MESSKTLLFDIKTYMNTNFKDVDALFNTSPYWEVEAYQVCLGHYLKKRIFDMNGRITDIRSYTPKQIECINKWCEHNDVTTTSVSLIKDHIRSKTRLFDFENDVHTYVTSKEPFLHIDILENILQLSTKLKTSIMLMNNKPIYTYLSSEGSSSRISFTTILQMAVQFKNNRLFETLKKHQPNLDYNKKLDWLFRNNGPDIKLGALYFALLEKKVEPIRVEGILAAYQLVLPNLSLAQIIESSTSHLIYNDSCADMPILF